MKIAALGMCVTVISCAFAVGQSTESVLYSFAGAPDGGYPSGGLLFDVAGNIYGTTVGGGTHCPDQGGCGIVYELSPSLTGYTESVLYNFCTTNVQNRCPDGANPYGGLISDKLGNLYGTTFLGGSKGLGVVFELSPPSVQGGSWTETTLWTFGERKDDGLRPFQGKLNWDAAGNLYGTTQFGGSHGDGTVFELSPNGTGSWKETILLSFAGTDGNSPQYGVAIDADGNLFGTASFGGVVNSLCSDGCGTVFELSPSANGWTGRILYKPTGANGSNPDTAITIDPEGNLYGTLQFGGAAGCYAQAGCGGVFKLVPSSGGRITKYSFLFDGQGEDGGNPWAGVLVEGDSAFGTTYFGNNVYEIKGKTETVLYQFCSQPSCVDGNEPLAGALVSHDGLLYGVTAYGGESDNGVVYSVTK
jgi:uncharacterized repeat protein (TIGR03803 family)